MWAFLMFYNIFMVQVKLMVKNHLTTVAYSSTDDSDTSDDEMEVDEEGDAFEEEVLKEREQDEKLVENLLNRILELKVGEILVNEFKNSTNVEESPAPQEVAAPQEADTQEAAPQELIQQLISPTENSVSDSPTNEGTPVADVIMDESA